MSQLTTIESGEDGFFHPGTGKWICFGFKKIRSWREVQNEANEQKKKFIEEKIKSLDAQRPKKKKSRCTSCYKKVKLSSTVFRHPENQKTICHVCLFKFYQEKLPMGQRKIVKPELQNFIVFLDSEADKKAFSEQFPSVENEKFATLVKSSNGSPAPLITLDDTDVMD